MLSSQIEGTQSSLSDLLLFELDEAPGVPFDDVVEVSSCVGAPRNRLFVYDRYLSILNEGTEEG